MSQRLSILNPNPQKLPGPDNLHHLVATDGYEGKPAIEYALPNGGVESVDYHQLHQRANSLARTIRSSLVSTSTNQAARLIVPIFLQQCPLLYIAQLAVLKAGAAFCPLTLDVPEDRLRFILKDVEANVLLTTKELRRKLPVLDSISIISVDDFDSDLGSEQLPDHVNPSSPAYIMYTSGSTGQPKGVILSHSAATQALLAHDRHIPQFSRFLQFASPTFDVSVFEIFFPLYRGRTLICGDRRRLLNDLPGFINNMDVDAAELTPSVASNLLRGREQLPSLTLLLTIGEMLKRDVIEEYGAASPERSILYGMYGPTEATIHCTLQTRFTSDMPIGNIGVPLETVSAFVIEPASDEKSKSDEAKILAIDEEGELAVGGYQLADGYLNRPEQTKAAFVDHSEFGRLYRTGDRVRLTKSGMLECSGRISSGQVKLRGQRIELGEIEYAAGQTPGCQTAVAEIVAGSLIVFCVCSHQQSDKTRIRQTCRKWLPAFMVPSDILILDELPYLESGKIDRKSLRSIYQSKKAQINGTAQEEDENMRSIMQVISRVLGAEIRAGTSLMAAGMDSLSSIRISAELKRRGFPRLDAIELMESTTARDVDAQLRKRISEEEMRPPKEPPDVTSNAADVVCKYSILADQPDEIDCIYPATATQSSMLLETARRTLAYCNWIEFEASSVYDVNEVSVSLQKLADAHGLLRSGFIATDEFESGHAVVTWSHIRSSQVRLVDDFEYDNSITDDENLLRPCIFQIKSCNKKIRILLQIHHALYDQWSVDVLRQDLHDLFQGDELPLRPSFKAISDFHCMHADTDQTEDDLDFWTDLLHDYKPTPIPAMISRRVPSALDRTTWLTLDCNLRQVREKAQQLQCSVPSIFQSAVAYLLGSYVNSTDVTLGVVLSGRHIPVDGVEEVFGPCLSTLPLRVDYSTVRTVTELVHLVHTTIQAMQKHSLTPLVDIKDAVKDAGSRQLFDTLFVWQESTVDSQADELSVNEVDSADQHEYNLVLEFDPEGHNVRMRATFQQALLSFDQVKLMAAQIQHYVTHVVSDPGGLVQDMASGLPESCLSISNPQPQECARGHNLVKAIEEHARVLPSTLAVVFAKSFDHSQPNAVSITYQELNERSNRMARMIRSHATQEDKPVCIYMEKSIELYVTILGCIKAGIGYLPIILDTPRARVESILQQAGVYLCICDENTHDNLEGMQDVLALNYTHLNLSEFGASSLNIDFPDDRVAYTVFTSGSTGQPKGVPVTMSNLLGNLQVLSELYPTRDGDRLLQACSHAFDVSVFEIFFTFYTGLCLCAARKEVLFKDFEQSIRQLGITHLSLTPTVAALVDPAAVSSVRFLVTAGEAVTNTVHSKWAGRGLHQGYGPSETTNICSVNMNASPEDALGNIGPPLRNTSAFVISTGQECRALPAGALGEFAFGGEQVFPGYIGQSDLNESKIIQHPQYGRIYRSGDLGRILPDGSMLIQGRLDDQVKVRGNRIEPGEINSILLRSCDVHDCSTLVIGQDATTQSIASFVASSVSLSTSNGKAKGMTRNDLIGHLFQALEESLPSYMVPNTITIVAEMPRTSQGKLDYQALRDLLHSREPIPTQTFEREGQNEDTHTDWSSDEIKIADLLAQVLHIETSKFTRRASLFSLGLNSLNAISLAKKLSQELSTRVSVAAILDNPSIARLARSVEPKPTNDLSNGNHDESELLPSRVVESIQTSLPFPSKDIECIFPCTPLQEAMLSGSIATSNKAYWNTLTLRIHGDIREMKRCWEHMVERHGILRTRFVSTDDREHPFAQIVLKSTKLIWNNEQAASTDSTSHSTILLAGPDEDLTHSAPFYIDCASENDGASIVVHMHHAVYDGVSISRLLDEVQTVHDDFVLEPTASASFAKFLQEAQKHRGQGALAFWSRELHGFQPRPMPRLQKAADSKEYTVENTLPISVDELNRVCQHHSINQLAMFQTALVKILSACQNIKDICFANIVSGRTVPVPGVEELIAPCFNAIPVRTNLRDNASNISIASELHRKNIASLRHQLTPLRRIQTCSLSPEKDLFECLLILQPPQKHLDPRIWTLVDHTGDMDLPLVFELFPTDNDFKLVLHYSEEYISDAHASQLSKAFSAAVTSCLTYPSGSIGDFSGRDISNIEGLLANDEEQHVQANFVDTADSSECSEEESLVCDAFAQLANLPRKSIKRSTSMFQIGLDSLNAPQIARKLRSVGLDVDAGDVLEGLTPAAIAIRAQEKTSDEPDQFFDIHHFDKKHRRKVLKTLRVSAKAIESVWPCTPIQSGMLLQSLQSHGDLYINHITYNVPSDISNKDIGAAWTKLAAKYQVLRVGFHKIDDTKIPFAMSTFISGSISTPFIEHHDELSVKHIEQQAKELIMRNVNRQAWCVQVMRHNDERLMTLSLHHALYDADSLALILNDFAEAVASSDLGSPDNVEDALVANLNATLDSSKAQSTFWSTALKSTSASKFPDLTPTVVANTELEFEDYELNVTLDNVEDFCKAHNATIQALGQTVWAIMLSAYIGDDNVVFGTIFSGHHTRSTETTAFPSITTIPVPCDTSCSSLELLSKMVRFNASAHRHRFMPLAEIQRLAESDDSTLFDTVFVHQRSKCSQFDWNVIAETASVDYTASLELRTSQQGSINLRLTYRADLIPPHQARLILRQYEHILTELMSRQQDHPTSLLSILPAKQSEIPEDAQLLHQMFERSVTKHPNKIALTFVHRPGKRESSMSWTYGELNYRANQVANLIHNAGVLPGSIVAVSMEKSPDASFAFLGILKAGCSFLAIDPDLPKARLEFILQDSDAKLLFVNEGKHQSFERDAVQCIELHSTILDRYSQARNDVAKISPDTTCYCLYTSGTTGTPKGCEITHENAVQAMKSFQRLFAGHWTERSRWLQFASYWFDVSVLEQFWSWSVGIEVVGALRDVVLEDLPGFISRQNITHIDLTPSLARLVQPKDVPSLWGGVFITGGEALKQEIIDAWGPKETICNGYGPTEATIGVTMNTFIGTDAKPSNIGRQFDNVGTFVLKPHSDQPVLRGAVGELCVSGKLVGKGYLNRSDLTASQFPTLDGFYERIYRTGDLVRLLADDSFSFVGRKDSQAKLRGQRLETSEVDSVVHNSSDHISFAATLITKAGPANKETLVSYLAKTALHSERPLEIDMSDHGVNVVASARAACTDRLPGYMVPTHILPINFLPLTVNNKVDTKRLVQLFTDSTSKDLQTLSGSGSGEPSSALTSSEQEIRNTLGDLLSIEPHDISAESNLFSVGLSSISAIAFARSLKRRGFKKASVAAVMSNPTISHLDTAINSSTSGDQNINDAISQAKLSLSAFAQRHCSLAARALDISLDEIEAVAPCTPLQQGLILDSMRLAKHPYFNDFTYFLSEVDVPRLRNSVQQLVAHAQILRTCFVDTDHGTAQIVLKQVKDISIQTHDVASTAQAIYLDEIRSRWINKNSEMLIRPFEVHLIMAPDRCLLRINIHHALYDGISFDLLLRRLCDLYVGQPPEDPGPTFISALPYGPLRHFSDAKSFWQKRLEGWPRTPISQSQERQRHENVVASKIIDANSLEATRKRLGVSHQAIMQSCFEIAFASCQPSIHEYGIVVSGRSIELAGADKILGPMFNTLPLPLRVVPKSTFEQYTRARHDDNIAILPYQHTPLREIRKWVGWNPNETMFDVLFVFQHEAEQGKESNSSLMKEVASEPQAHYPLSCEVELSDSGDMNVLVSAQRDYFDQKAVQSLVNTLEQAMQCLVHSPRSTLHEKFGIVNEATIQTKQNEMYHGNQVNGVQHFEWTQPAMTIRAAIAALLNLDKSDVDEHSTLFALGLDSIDAVKLASRLRNAGLLVPVSKLLKAQTIPRILDAAEASTASDTKTVSALSRIADQLVNLTPTLSTLHPNDVEAVLPTTPTQEALLADMYRTELREYFNHDILRLRHDTDINRLQRAWQTVIDHAAVLRTIFIEVAQPEIDTAFAQVVLKRHPQWVEFHDCDSKDELGALLDTIRRDVADMLESRPPTRISFIKVGEENYMIVSLAHAQYDGHSLALLHQDVRRAYYDHFTPRPSYNSALEAALTAIDNEALRFWQDTLSNSTPVAFPRINTDADSTQTWRDERATAITTSTARKFCRIHAVSMQALAQTCWALTLAHYVRRMEVTFGIVLACRDSEEAEEVMFPTMNTVAFRASLCGTRAEMVQNLQSLGAEMLPYQRTPLRAIRAAVSNVLRAPKQCPENGLFDTLFIYQHSPSNEDNFGEALYDSVGGSSDVEYPIAVEIEAAEGDSVVIRTACRSSVLDEIGTEQLLETVEEVLTALINSPNEPTVDFDGQEVSICGMESFQPEGLEDDANATEVDAVEYGLDMDTHPATDAIIEGLSQIAKVPKTDINASSTIESIGIDSISAIKVAALLRQQAIHLTVSQILQSKTAAKMAQSSNGIPSRKAEAERVSRETVSSAVQPYVESDLLRLSGIEPGSVETVMPATAGQIYMMSMWRKTHGQLFYPTFKYELEGDVEIKAVNEAWKALVNCHAILRTVFCATGDISMPVLQAILRKDTASGTQSVVSLNVQENGRRRELSLSIHHALYDAVSLPLLIQDLESLLANRPLENPKLSFEDFLAPTTSHRSRQIRKHFWSDYLDGISLSSLKQPEQDGPQRKVEIFRQNLVRGIADIERAVRKQNLSLQSLLFAAYAKVYASLVGISDDEKSDVVLGIYLSNRSHLSDLETLTAPTLNLVPLLVRLPRHNSLVRLAKQIHEDLQKIGNVENSMVGLWEVEQWTGIKVDTFVNFLKLPETNQDDGSEQGSVKIKPMDDSRLQQRSQVVGPDSGGGFEMSKELEAMRGLDAYQHSLDIEVTVMNNNLAIGMFCPESMINLHQAEEALTEFKTLMQTFATDPME